MRNKAAEAAGLTRVVEFRSQVASGLVGVYRAYVIVAFRGSKFPRDWLLTNIEIRKMHRFYGKVHSGFVNAIDTVWDNVRTHITKRTDCSSVRDILFTGHSLGGALAILAGQLAVDEDFPVAAVYTFGAPPVGNHKFAATYAPTHYRLEHGSDYVPHVLISAFFKHSGELRYLPKGRHEIMTQEGLNLVGIWLHTVWRWTMSALSPISRMTDHPVAQYHNYLASILRED